MAKDSYYLRSILTLVLRKPQILTSTVLHIRLQTHLRMRRTAFRQGIDHGEWYSAQGMKPVLAACKGNDLAMYTRCSQPLRLRNLSLLLTNAFRDIPVLNET